MDDIKEIISTLTERDKLSFTRFLNIEKAKDNRRDLDLFERLCKEDKPDPSEFKTQKEKDSYHQNRKRLMESLAEFVVLKSRLEDITGGSRIMGMITLARYLFDQKQNRLGWKILRKAEELAWEQEHYDLLNTIYVIQVENSRSFHAVDLKTIIRNKGRANKLAYEDESVIIATEIIRQKLQEVMVSGKSLNFTVYLEKVFMKFKISEAVFERPKHLYNILMMVRSSYLAARSLKNFENFAVEQYLKAERNFGFKKQHHYYKLQILYVIAHVYYRNRKFKKAYEYLNLLHQNMELYGKSHYSKFIARYISLFSTIKSFTGYNDEAIALHEQILFKKNNKLNIKDNLNMHLNLVAFYFYAKKFSKANRILNSHEHSDNWLAKKMGREWVLRKNLIDVTIQYELGNEDIALNRLKLLEKNFSDMFVLPQYEKVGVFINLTKQYLVDPYKFPRREFLMQIKRETAVFSLDKEESKSLAFYAWLRSKVEEKDYYSLLVETVKSKEDL